jgi:hypothetical protein
MSPFSATWMNPSRNFTPYEVRNKVDVLPQPFLAPGNVTRRNPPNSQESTDFQTGSRVNPYFTQPPEPAPPPLPAAPLRPQNVKDFSSLARLVDTAFICPWQIFLDAIATNARRIALKKLSTELFITQATKAVQMELDNEAPMPNSVISAIVDQKTAERTKRLESEFSKVQKQLIFS